MKFINNNNSIINKVNWKDINKKIDSDDFEQKIYDIVYDADYEYSQDVYDFVHDSASKNLQDMNIDATANENEKLYYDTVEKISKKVQKEIDKDKGNDDEMTGEFDDEASDDKNDL